MSYTVSTTPLFTSGEIKFSELRQKFKETDTGTVSAKELLRYTDETIEPLLPDSTENAAVPSTESNWKTSLLRNTIKNYTITQDTSTTDTDANVDDLSWNSNFAKNIVKYFDVRGTIGSTSQTDAAVRVTSNAPNLKIRVYGDILGAGCDPGASGGTGGVSAIGSSPYNGQSAPGESGDTGTLGSGGITISSTQTVVVDVKSTGKVYGGGRCGDGGDGGTQGLRGTCYYYSYYYTGYNCGGCPGCGGNTRVGCQSGGGCNCSKKGCANTNQRARCRVTNGYAVRGGQGGTGGTGGLGQGYNQDATEGTDGLAGESSGCPPIGNSPAGGVGGTGGTGANATDGSAYGTGAAGISGTGYDVIGSVSNIRGGYD